MGVEDLIVKILGEFGVEVETSSRRQIIGHAKTEVDFTCRMKGATIMVQFVVEIHTVRERDAGSLARHKCGHVLRRFMNHFAERLIDKARWKEMTNG